MTQEQALKAIQDKITTLRSAILEKDGKSRSFTNEEIDKLLGTADDCVLCLTVKDCDDACVGHRTGACRDAWRARYQFAHGKIKRGDLFIVYDDALDRCFENLNRKAGRGQ